MFGKVTSQVKKRLFEIQVAVAGETQSSKWAKERKEKADHRVQEMGSKKSYPGYRL